MAVYTVTQVTAYLKDTLDRDPFLGDLWVNGEVSNLSRASSGAVYFTLKDAQSQVRCVMFRPGHYAELLHDGDAIVAHGRLSLYPARGQLQVYVDLVQPEGTGILHLELERLKARLEDEGLFDPSRKRPLPPFPMKVGVVTSPTGAVFHDICNVVQRRFPLAEVVLSPTPVQGDSAAPEIVEAIRALNDMADVDVIIIARGGGSLEELWPFNEEAVARAIYGSRVAVISGVGHETDVTIADLVADYRAPTPSAAAEVSVPDAARLQDHVAALQRTAFGIVDQMVSQRRQQLDYLVRQLRGRGPQVQIFQQRVDDLTQALARGLSSTLALAKERFAGIEQHLSALNPTAILERGYSYVQRTADSTPVTSVAQVHPDDALHITVSDGSFDVRAV